METLIIGQLGGLVGIILGILIGYGISSAIDFDFVITVCDNAKESCPYFPTKAIKFHHNFPDPAKATGTEEEILQRFREVRETIKKYSKNFITNNL